MKNNTMTIKNRAAYMPAINPPSSIEEEYMEQEWNDYLDAKQSEYDMFDRPVAGKPWDI